MWQQRDVKHLPCLVLVEELGCKRANVRTRANEQQEDGQKTLKVEDG